MSDIMDGRVGRYPREAVEANRERQKRRREQKEKTLDEARRYLSRVTDGRGILVCLGPERNPAVRHLKVMGADMGEWVDLTERVALITGTLYSRGGIVLKESRGDVPEARWLVMRLWRELNPGNDSVPSPGFATGCDVTPLPLYND